MSISKEMRLLLNKWNTGNSFPKRLDAVQITNIRGWEGQRIEFKLPIVAICGENGAGKSTILQAAASVYSRDDEIPWFASDFFPDTPWEVVSNAEIGYTVRQGPNITSGSVRKPTDRWRGNPGRPQRHVEYVDLGRLQPVSGRTGYLKLAKPSVLETRATQIENDKLRRLSEIMGRSYSAGKMAGTDADDDREVTVVSIGGKEVSGFHQGAGESVILELLQKEPPQYSLVLIDEVETSLHPRAQRRLMRDLAELCRLKEWQIILTTHSPYILDQLPPDARAYILPNNGKKEVVFGVSPDFAMTQMDDEIHPECDLFVEDERAKLFLQEILVQFAPDLIQRVDMLPFGAATVGQALGQMVKNQRFKRPTLVFLDGDQPVSEGCILLPGGDAPERIVFKALKSKQWSLLDSKTSRDFAQLADACDKAMTAENHHEWVDSAATKVVLSGDSLWQAMCAEWAANCLDEADAEKIIAPIREALILE